VGMLARSNTDMSDVVNTYLENSKFFGKNEPELSSMENASDQLKLIRTFLTLAVEQAEARGLTPDDGEFLSLIDEAFECATSVTNAFTPPTSDGVNDGRAQRAFRMRWSAQPGTILHDARRMGAMEVSGACLEDGVGRYLRSPFRDPRIDRVLVRALADTELSNFLWLQVGPGIPFMSSPLETAQQGLVWPFVKRTLTGLAVTAVVLAGLIALMTYFPATPDWLVLGGIVLAAGGYMLLTAASLVALAVYGPKVAETRRAAMETIRAAVNFYTEFHGTGTVSLAHYRKCMDEARQKGVVWPSTMWALVDDMEQRGVRHF
jgi:hypothetical protein